VRALVVALVALGACRGKPEPAPQQKPKPGSADPWAGADAAPETPATRQARIDAAIVRAKAMQPKLAKLRHLELLHEIPAEYQAKDDFRAFVHKEVEKEATNDKDETIALVQIGLLPAGVDLAKAEEQAFATQAAAYYDPAQKKFFLVMVPDAPAMLDITSAHELTHGLTDQHFDLRHLMGEDGKTKLDDDALSARRFVVEGDATFAMFLYAMTDMIGTGGEPSPAAIKMIRGQLEGIGDVDSMIDMISQQTGLGSGLGSGDIAESMKALHDIPRAILVPMIDSYMKGALLAIWAYEAGGWSAVDELYKHPPESTSQALHPGKRGPPKKIELPKLPGYDQVTVNVIGELEWGVYFSLWKHSGNDKVQEGWAGDRYALERRKGGTGGVAVAIATAWDSELDAKAFADAFESTIAARMAAAGHTGKIAVKLAGKHVFIVDGDDSAAVMDALVAGAKIEP
jgi:hypothetical protein